MYCYSNEFTKVIGYKINIHNRSEDINEVFSLCGGRGKILYKLRRKYMKSEENKILINT